MNLTREVIKATAIGALFIFVFTMSFYPLIDWFTIGELFLPDFILKKSLWQLGYDYMFVILAGFMLGVVWLIWKRR